MTCYRKHKIIMYNSSSGTQKPSTITRSSTINMKTYFPKHGTTWETEERMMRAMSEVLEKTREGALAASQARLAPTCGA